MAGYTDIPPSYFDTLIARPGEMLADTAVGVIEGGRKLRDMYNTTEDYLDEGLARVGDLFDRSPPRMAGGPMSRNTIRTPRLNRVRASLNENQVMPFDSTDRAYLAGLTKENFNYYFPTQQAYDDAVAEGHLANKEYNIMRSGMDYPVDDYNNREYNIMRHGVDYPTHRWEDEMHDLGRSQDARHPHQWKESDNRSDWQKWKDSTKSRRR